MRVLAQIAERTIHDDMEYLIKHTVDPRKADYAVISGIQIHSWGEKFDDAAPNLEYIAPCSVYCVVAGERTYLDLFTIPGLTPRQISVLSASISPTDRTKPIDPDEVPCPSPAHQELTPGPYKFLGFRGPSSMKGGLWKTVAAPDRKGRIPGNEVAILIKGASLYVTLAGKEPIGEESIARGSRQVYGHSTEQRGKQR